MQLREEISPSYRGWCVLHSYAAVTENQGSDDSNQEHCQGERPDVCYCDRLGWSFRDTL